MKRKINNPYPSNLNECFGCSTKNPCGLKLNFEENGDYITATWQPEKHYQGFVNVIHGGIIATLLDEISAWYVSVKLGTAGVTKSLNIEYVKPLYLSKGPVLIRAKMLKLDKNLVTLKSELLNNSDILCAQAISKFFLFPEKIAIERFNYPGKEAF